MLPRIDPSRRLPAFGLFLAVGLFAALFAVLASPSDPKNSVLFGFSLERMILAAGIFTLAGALLFLTWKLARDPERSQRFWLVFTRHNASLFLSVVVFLLCWVALFMPPYRLGGLSGYIQRLSPLLVWLAVTGAVTTALLLVERKKASTSPAQAVERVVIKTSLIFLGAFLLLGGVALVTGIGYRHPTEYWYGAGVPVLGLQVLFALIAGALIFWFEPKIAENRRGWFDALFFAGLWIAAAWLWAREPLAPNYFMPDTADNIIYPYSDGATFDTGGQYALIGQGLFNGRYFDRVLYSVFLTYLHIFFGQDFDILMAVQAAVFAVFPAVVYLLGRELHSRALGVSAGILIALRGLNAIVAARWIDTASPKMALTDFPTAIGIAFFLLFLLKWGREPARINHLIWAGTAFGLTLLVRTHVLTLLPVALVFIPLALRLRWKQAALTACLLVLGLLAVTLPWEIRNQSRGIPMFYMYYSRIELLLRYRYGILEEASLPPQEMDAAQPGIFPRERLRLKFAGAAEEPFCDSLPCSVTNHFVHNIVTSVISLPSSFVFDDIWNTVKADTPYWKRDWNEGQIGNAGAVLLLFNLVLLALGSGAVWGRSRSLTLLPVFLFLAYLLTNSLGLTSGGRYIAPVDWMVSLFYAAGGLQLVIWFLRLAGAAPEVETAPMETAGLQSLKREQYFKALPVLFVILGIGALMPAVEMFFEPRYQTRSVQETLADLEAAGLLEQSGFSREELTAFLSQPKAMLTAGRALYPRYYRTGEGEPDRSTYYRYLDYQRLVFTLIGPYAAQAEGVVIPGDPPPFSFHTADVVVLGCWNTAYYAPFVDGVVVFVTSGEGYVYNRAPGAPLKCPLPEP
ncbi:MAG: hypothetical protein DPW18_10965 [Chloroflexi bacterium]|nr:hypothetical protein [Chloroflexota bacterium]MDL1944211.1 hypothetical protein [Chloroflexi bacterium CFX2]